MNCVHIMDIQIENKKMIEKIIEDAVKELERANKKHGLHAGPKRAINVLKAEMQELITEVEAEDYDSNAVDKECVQVIAMGIKFLLRHRMESTREKAKLWLQK